MHKGFRSYRLFLEFDLLTLRTVLKLEYSCILKFIVYTTLSQELEKYVFLLDKSCSEEMNCVSLNNC